MIPSLCLKGKVAIVTGGKSGIGKSIALAFAEAGADVAVCGRTVEDGKLSAVADQINRFGQRSLSLIADISQRADVDNMVGRVTNEFGHIDILVNNAGLLIKAPFLEVPEGDWDRIIDTHLKGYFFCSQAVAKQMVKQRDGSIINVASAWAIEAALEAGVYCIAKAGVVMLTKVLAVELASHNIRANAIAPGAVLTEMFNAEGKPEVLEKETASVPMGRLADTNDIIGTALYLASGASSYVTGHTIPIEGGKLAKAR